MGELAEAIAQHQLENKLVERLKQVHTALVQWESSFSQALERERVAALSDALSTWRRRQEFQGMEELAQLIGQQRAEEALAEHLAVFETARQQVAQQLLSNQSPLQQLGELVRSLRENTASTPEAVAQEVDKLAGTLRRQSVSPTPPPQRAWVEAFWQPDYPFPPPQHILPHHWQEFQASAIHPELIALNAESLCGDEVYERLLSDKLAKLGSGQYVTVPMAREMAKYESLAQGGWWGNAGIDALSLLDLEPSQTPSHSLWGCFKPDHPRIDPQKSQRKGKTEYRKYENPASAKRVPFLPQVPDHLAEQIYQKHGINPTEAERHSGFWFVVQRYPQIPITITEGFKKTLASLSQGEVTIGLSGVNHIYRSKDDFGNKLPQRQLNEEVAVFAQPGREFRFAYDQDPKVKTILNVRRDLVRGVELLAARGCPCKVVKWKSEAGKGLDDLIAQQGPQAYHLAQRAAILAEREQRIHYRTQYNQIVRRVRQELGNIGAERLDLEVYLSAIEKGELADGIRVVGESDRSRSLRAHSPEVAGQYVQAIAAVAGTYQRLKLREVDDLERWATQVVQVKAASLATKPEPERQRRLGPQI